MLRRVTDKFDTLFILRSKGKSNELKKKVAPRNDSWDYLVCMTLIGFEPTTASSVKKGALSAELQRHASRNLEVRGRKNSSAKLLRVLLRNDFGEDRSCGAPLNAINILKCLIKCFPSRVLSNEIHG